MSHHIRMLLAHLFIDLCTEASRWCEHYLWWSLFAWQAVQTTDSTDEQTDTDV